MAEAAHEQKVAYDSLSAVRKFKVGDPVWILVKAESSVGGGTWTLGKARLFTSIGCSIAFSPDPLSGKMTVDMCMPLWAPHTYPTVSSARSLPSQLVVCLSLEDELQAQGGECKTMV